MPQPQGDSWHFGVLCHQCGSAILPFVDRSAGQKPISFGGGGKLRITCPYRDCQYQDDYGSEEVKCFRVTEAP